MPLPPSATNDAVDAVEVLTKADAVDAVEVLTTVDDVEALTTALTSITKNYAIQGIKCMTTDLDNVMVQLKTEFDTQLELCNFFRHLALEYRPIRMEAVATVVSLKDFSDTTYKMLIPMLEEALNDGSVEDTKEVIDELVDMYLNVHEKLQGLKAQHNEITQKAKGLGQTAAAKAQQHQQESQIMKTQGDRAGYAAGGGGVGLGAAAITMVCVGVGPIGWCCLGGAGLITVGAAGRLTYAQCGKETQDALSKSAVKINEAMTKVTNKLDEQCEAMQKIVSKLSNARDSTEKIQKIVDEWTAGKISRMKTKRLETWMGKLPDDMKELSGYCQEYLGNEGKDRERLMDAMNFSVENGAPAPVAQEVD